MNNNGNGMGLLLLILAGIAFPPLGAFLLTALVVIVISGLIFEGLAKLFPEKPITERPVADTFPEEWATVKVRHDR